MLLGKDERIIFMDTEVDYETPTVRVPKEDLASLVSIGVKTSMSCSTQWRIIQPEKDKERDWSFYDQRMEDMLSVGMKVYFHCVQQPPPWLPKEWCTVDMRKVVSDVPSMWNHEAWDYTLQFITEARDRYNCNDIMVINSWLHDGETITAGEFACFDQAAIKDHIEKFGRIPEAHNPESEAWYKEKLFQGMNDINRILITDKNELWSMLHPAISTYGNGSQWYEEYLASIRVTWPEATINQLYYTWTQWDSIYPRIKSMSETYRTQVFGGAEYATGIYDNSIKAIANGLRGVLCGPTHPYTKNKRIEQWMLDNMSDSLALWPVIVSEP
jgi:hypothetical protein